MNEFLFLWLGFDRMFTVAARHRHEKCDSFIYLLIYRTQREHKANIVEIYHHQNNCIRGLISRYEEVFLDRIKFKSNNFFAAIISRKIFIA